MRINVSVGWQEDAKERGKARKRAAKPRMRGSMTEGRPARVLMLASMTRTAIPTIVQQSMGSGGLQDGRDENQCVTHCGNAGRHEGPL